tara:strand:- start:139 stop:330 length:192 start_codon:yes stop_codon:yes gene_type:complete
MASYKRRVINVSNVRRFIDKIHVDLRVSDAFVDELEQKVEQLITQAAGKASAEFRTTLLERDI